jgi:hypothetical protein
MSAQQPMLVMFSPRRFVRVAAVEEDDDEEPRRQHSAYTDIVQCS